MAARSKSSNRARLRKLPLLYLFDRGCRLVRLPLRVYDYKLVAQPVTAASRLPRRRTREYRVRFIEHSDPSLEHMPISREVLEFRYSQGARCLGIFRGDALAAYLWICARSYDEDEVRCRFLPEPAETTVWDFDVYVMPAFRASFAFPALWDAADAYLREKGVRWTLSRISAFNRASVASHESLGACDVGRARFFRLGRLQIGAFSLPPYWHVSLSAPARPVLRVRAPRET